MYMTWLSRLLIFLLLWICNCKMCFQLFALFSVFLYCEVTHYYCCSKNMTKWVLLFIQETIWFNWKHVTLHMSLQSRINKIISKTDLHCSIFFAFRLEEVSPLLFRVYINKYELGMWDYIVLQRYHIEKQFKRFTVVQEWIPGFLIFDKLE